MQKRMVSYCRSPIYALASLRYASLGIGPAYGAKGPWALRAWLKQFIRPSASGSISRRKTVRVKETGVANRVVHEVESYAFSTQVKWLD